MRLGPLKLAVASPSDIPGFIVTVVLALILWRVLFAAAQKASGNRLPAVLAV